MSRYFQLENLNTTGFPLYNGIEYDSEVPFDGVVGSPGGTSSTFHHYNKGFYGIGSARSDIFAGQGVRYPYGERGNLYNIGPSGYPQNEFQPDAVFSKNESSPPGVESYSSVPIDLTPPPERVKITINPWMVLIIFFLASLAFDMFINSTELFLKKYHESSELTWTQYLLYGCIFLAIMILVAYFSGVSLLKVESL